MWARVDGVDWTVRVRLVRHASYILVPGTPEPGIAALFRALDRLVRPRVFWDAGANFGYYSWLLKSSGVDREVHLFEPDLDNVALIEATRERHGLAGVHVVPAAVSARGGSAVFVRDRVTGATGTLERSGQPASLGARDDVRIVSTVSLDEYAEGKSRVEAIKIDVEGHEERVLEGAAATIDRHLPIVVFECAHAASPAAAFFRERDYLLFDADRLTSKTDAATNFLALPPAFARSSNAVADLRRIWAEEHEHALARRVRDRLRSNLSRGRHAAR